MNKHLLLLIVFLSATQWTIGKELTGCSTKYAYSDPMDSTVLPPVIKNDLPIMAQKILSVYFKDIDIISCHLTHMGKKYLVRLKGKRRIFFNNNGEWIYIDCNQHGVPYELVPSKIRYQIAQRFGPYVHAVKIMRNKNKFNLVLNNQVVMSCEM